MTRDVARAITAIVLAGVVFVMVWALWMAWLERRMPTSIPPWERHADFQRSRGLCTSTRRSPQAISCFWSCSLPPGHAEPFHKCIIGGETVGSWDDAEAARSWEGKHG